MKIQNVDYIISVDLGTSSIRACLVGLSLKITHQVSQIIPLVTNEVGQAEQDSESIIQIAIACIDQILQWTKSHHIHPLALSFSNANGSLVCLDSNFKPIQPALTYLDMRASHQAQVLIETYGKAYFRTSATPVHATYWLPKFLWMRQTEWIPSNCHYFCTIKDLLVKRLTNKFVIDYSNAVATGMVNVESGNWDERLLNIAGINDNQLPEILPTTAVLDITINNSDLIHQTTHPIKIVLGAMDGVLSTLGVGAINPGQVTTTMGSSGACRIAARSPLIEQEQIRIWSYPLDESIWIRGGATNNGGLVTQWLAEIFSEGKFTHQQEYEDLFVQAKKIPLGADGLIFLPYLFGERAPIYNESARGVLFGLHSNHQRGHLIRAGLEGILLAFYSIFELITKDINQLTEIRATGGYVRSELMLQIQADIFGMPINIPSDFEGSVIGAAILAFKALNRVSTYNDLIENINIEKRYMPDENRHQMYQKIYTKFKALYERVQPLF
ncbi:MAG: gluconokinase [Anaerolineales bacterium]